jgi:hypothetical protein
MRGVAHGVGGGAVRLSSARSPGPLNILVLGDSTSYPTTGNWPAAFAAARPAGDVVTNKAETGIDNRYWSANPSQFASDVTATYNSSLGAKNNGRNCLLVLEVNTPDNNFNEWFHGTHGAAGFGYTNGATMFDAEQAPFYAQCEAVGWNVYPLTVDMFNDGEQVNTSGPLDTFHAYLQAANARMKAREGVGYRGKCLDFAAAFGATADSDPSAYYVVDGTISGGVDNGRPIAIHKTSAGIARMAAVIGALFNAAIL